MDQPTDAPLKKTKKRSTWWPRISIAITLLLIIGGVWYLSRTIKFSDIQDAITLADGRFILLAFLVMTANGASKAWRFGILLHPDPKKKIPYSALFWAVWLGQYVNMILPFLRFGEMARAYAIDYQTGIGKMRSFSTTVVEKTMDLLTLALTIAIIFPFVVLPEVVTNSWLLLSGLTVGVFVGLYLLAYRTGWVIGVFERMGHWLPGFFSRRVIPLMISGLEGLSSLRSRRATLLLIFSSLVTAVLSVLTPYVLFFALHIPLGLPAAGLVDSALSFTTTGPSTPGQLGVFEGTVFVSLLQLGIDNQAVIISYALVYHLIVLLPKIIFGGIAASRTHWTWQRERS